MDCTAIGARPPMATVLTRTVRALRREICIPQL
jgi:hypothetical protein